MNHTSRRVRNIILAAVLVMIPWLGAAQGSKSAAPVAELTRLLDQLKLDSIAARQAPDRFVAVLYFPGSQLLAVSGTPSAPERAALLLEQKKYRDLYIDLNSASVPQSKIFISDLGANGLHATRENNQPVDTVDRDGTSYGFDGDWAKAKTSESGYQRIFSATDDQYAQMLQALIAQLKKAP